MVEEISFELIIFQQYLYITREGSLNSKMTLDAHVVELFHVRA